MEKVESGVLICCARLSCRENYTVGGKVEGDGMKIHPTRLVFFLVSSMVLVSVSGCLVYFTFFQDGATYPFGKV